MLSNGVPLNAIDIFFGLIKYESISASTSTVIVAENIMFCLRSGRIENILGRKAPQTDASRAKIAELRNLQLAEMTDRYDRGESLSDIGRSTFTGKGMAFEKQSGGVSGKGTANERNYGGR